MNREIKFRVWKVYPKIFEYVSGLFFSDSYKWVKDLNSDDIITQYTGLKDKNGKEIYEGDILEFDADEWGGDNDNKSMVEWDGLNGGFYFGCGTTSEVDQFQTIIGNIFETPEIIGD